MVLERIDSPITSSKDQISSSLFLYEVQFSGPLGSYSSSAPWPGSLSHQQAGSDKEGFIFRRASLDFCDFSTYPFNDKETRQDVDFKSVLFIENSALQIGRAHV